MFTRGFSRGGIPAWSEPAISASLASCSAGGERADLLLEHLRRGDDAVHHRAVEDAAGDRDGRDPRIVLEPHRVTRPAPGHGERGAVLPGHHALAGRRVIPRDVLVVDQVEPVGLQDREDRLRRRVRREALPEHEDVERLHPRRLEREVRRDLTRGVHLRDAGGEQEPAFGELRAPSVLGLDHPVLLARRVEVVGADVEAGLGDLVAVADERPDGVADDLRSLEELGELRHIVRGLDDLMVDRVDAGNVGDDVLRPLFVPAHRRERDVQLAQVLADQAARVAGGAVDNDWLGHRHIPIPPSTGRPIPVMNRA